MKDKDNCFDLVRAWQDKMIERFYVDAAVKGIERKAYYVFGFKIQRQRNPNHLGL